MNTRVKKLPGVAITLAIAVALLPLAPAYALGASTGTVTGSVTSAQTGAAIADVKVRVLDMKTAEYVAETVTNEEGVLDLSALPYGLYQVSVVAPEGYASAAGPLVNLNADNPEARVGFSLESLPGAASSGAVGGVPTWVFVALSAAAIAVIATVVALGGNPDLPQGTG